MQRGGVRSKQEALKVKKELAAPTVQSTPLEYFTQTTKEIWLKCYNSAPHYIL